MWTIKTNANYFFLINEGDNKIFSAPKKEWKINPQTVKSDNYVFRNHEAEVLVADYKTLKNGDAENASFATKEDFENFVFANTGNFKTASGSSEAPVQIGFPLLKTGQTVSFRTGDDGDIQAGRSNNTFRLNSNNPFGNDFRFTGVTVNEGYTDGFQFFDNSGNQTTKALAFPNGVVIDWSTFGEKQVLGIDLELRGDDNWDSATDKVKLLTTGGYNSNWRLPNMRELDLLSIVGFSRRYAYQPFGFNGNNRFWTSTTLQGYTNIPYMFMNQWSSSGASASSSYNWFAVRTFTVNGTILS